MIKKNIEEKIGNEIPYIGINGTVYFDPLEKTLSRLLKIIFNF